MLEGEFQKQVIKTLKAKKWYVIRTQMGIKSGISDLLIMKNGRTIWLELKRPDGKGKPSLQQIKVVNDIINHGCEAYFVKSIEELEEIIKNH